MSDHNKRKTVSIEYIGGKNSNNHQKVIKKFEKLFEKYNIAVVKLNLLEEDRIEERSNKRPSFRKRFSKRFSRQNKKTQNDSNPPAQSPQGSAQNDANHRAQSPQGSAQNDANHRAQSPQGSAQNDPNRRAQSPQGSAQNDANRRAQSPQGFAQNDPNHRAQSPQGFAQNDTNRRAQSLQGPEHKIQIHTSPKSEEERYKNLNQRPLPNQTSQNTLKIRTEQNDFSQELDIQRKPSKKQRKKKEAFHIEENSSNDVSCQTVQNDNSDTKQIRYTESQKSESRDVEMISTGVNVNRREITSPHECSISRSPLCDGCSKGITDGNYFHCLQCKNYNLCDFCFQCNKHSAHSMLIMRKSLPEYEIDQLVDKSVSCPSFERFIFDTIVKDSKKYDLDEEQMKNLSFDEFQIVFAEEFDHNIDEFIKGYQMYMV